MVSLPVRKYTLAPFCELRIVTSDTFANSPLKPTLTLLNTQAAAVDRMPKMRGAAEIYGRELVTDQEYAIEEGERLAVFTWVGCSVQVKGMVQQEYEGEGHAMKEYLNVINALNSERELATVKRTQGPRVLITGAPSSGKSSVSMILCNYAVRSGWTPLFVEADPRASTDKRPLQFYPGTIGAAVMTSVTDKPAVNPLVYFYGYSDVQEHSKLYTHVSRAMAATLDIMMHKSLAKQPHSRRSDEVDDVGKYIAASGMIINAPYSANRDIVVQLAEMFSVTMVLVIDSPSVHQDLVRTFASIRDNAIGAAQTAGLRGDLMAPSVLGNLAFQDQPDSAHAAQSRGTAAGEEPSQDAKNGKEAPQDVIVLAVNKLEGVVPVDRERIKYLNTRCWRRYFERATAGEMHVVKFAMESVRFVFLDTTAALSKDALPTDDVTTLHTEEMYASPWTGDPVCLTNSVLGVPSTADMRLIPYCNLLGFFLVRSVEELAAPPALGEDEEPQPAKYVIEALCPVTYSPSALPAFLVVAGNQRVMKLQTV